MYCVLLCFFRYFFSETLEMQIYLYQFVSTYTDVCRMLCSETLSIMIILHLCILS